MTSREFWSYALVLAPAAVTLVLAIVACFKPGEWVWDNVVTLETAHHLVLHAVFIMPAATALLFELSFSVADKNFYATPIKLTSAVAVALAIGVGWGIGYRLHQLEQLDR